MFAFHQTTTSARVYLQTDTSPGMFESGIIPEGATNILTNTITSAHLFKPKIRLHYSDFLGYELNMTEPSPGSLKIAYEYDGVKNQKTILVQVIITFFSIYIFSWLSENVPFFGFKNL